MLALVPQNFIGEKHLVKSLLISNLIYFKETFYRGPSIQNWKEIR
jgi:hypothetical protein